MESGTSALRDWSMNVGFLGHLKCVKLTLPRGSGRKCARTPKGGVASQGRHPEVEAEGGGDQIEQDGGPEEQAPQIALQSLDLEETKHLLRSRKLAIN